MSISYTKSLIENLKILWNILNKKERIKAIKFIVFAFFQGTLEMISIGSLYPLMISFFNDTSKIIDLINHKLNFLNFNQINLSAGNFIFYLSLIILVIFLLKNLFLIFLVHWTQKFERDVMVRLKSNLLEKYLYKDYLFHVDNDTGFLVRNVHRSTNTVMQSIRSSMMLINDTSIFIFLISFMFFINKNFVIYSFFVVLLLSTIYFFIFKKILIKFGHFAFTHEGDAMKRLLQAFQMIKEIKLFNKENYFLDYFKTEEGAFQTFQKKAFIIRTYPRFFFEMLFILGLLIFLNINLIMSQPINEILPKIAIITLLILRILPSINRIIQQMQKLNQYQKSNEIIFDELSNLYTVPSKHKSNNIEINNNTYPTFKSICFKDISFCYPGQDKLIFDKFNFQINKGDFLGIVGKSGSGKSTLIDIITGLLGIKKGKIFFNDIHVVEIDKNWNNIFGYVSQNANLFNDSILTNITFEKEDSKIDMNKFKKVIQQSGLKNFIEDLDRGISTNIGDLGNKISGGEKQRISIARSLYKDAEILIFDESFNSLDNDTKQKILNEIKNLSKFKSIIMISHSKEDLINCNKILDLDKIKIENSTVS